MGAYTNHLIIEDLFDIFKVTLIFSGKMNGIDVQVTKECVFSYFIFERYC